MKKRISMAIAVATAAATMASVSVPVMADDVNITIFNSKMEVQSQFEELAAQYAEETGVGVEVYYNSDTVSAHLATRYSANDPYTIAMVDPKDIYSLAADHAIDLSDQSWVNETDYAIGLTDRSMVSRPALKHAVLFTMQMQSKQSQARPSIRMITRHLILLKSFLRN